MGKLDEIPQEALIRCVAIYPNGEKKVRHFPDDENGLKAAVRWEWEQMQAGATKLEYYRDDQKKGTFYSTENWVPFNIERPK